MVLDYEEERYRQLRPSNVALWKYLQVDPSYQLGNRNCLVCNMLYKVMIFYSNMLHSWCEFWALWNPNATVVIFEYFAVEFWFWIMKRENIANFDHKVHEWHYSLIAWDRPLYSASAMLNAISVCSLLHHVRVNPAYIIIKPVLYRTHSGLVWSPDDQPPENSAST